jgi:type I restriction enzyme R subunit
MVLNNDIKYRGELGKSLKLDEYNSVELPFMKQLRQLGWNQVIELNVHQTPEQSFRNSFSEVVLLPKLKASLKRINSFLTESQIDEVVRRICTFDRNNLIENNQKVLDLLLENTTVSRNEITGEQSPTVRYIDFENLGNNIFTAISQFKVSISGDHHIIPDIVLFVNGLPMVVVEAKSPRVNDPISEAIDQLMRYSEQRGFTGEGNKELFYYNQFIVTTCRTESKFGTITTRTPKHFYRWTDPYPKTLNELEHGQSSPNDQQRLVAGMLDPRNLLDIVRVFTVFSTNEKGQKIKLVGRYQQFRAVKITTKRLIDGKNKWERGGIIWHTQGSGKSLTMMFLVREMKLQTALMPWKIVFVTDRTQLEDQLAGTAHSIGFTIKTANFINPRQTPDGYSLKELLSNDNSDLVMAMIHKFQENGDLDGSLLFPELNKITNILVLTDEAHRAQYSLLAANMERAMPNATLIGFTGTPTQKTEKKYKDYIDKYTMRQSIDDGVTLEIVYEGFTHNAEVEDKSAMDKKFEDVFSDYSLTERLQILGFGSRDAYLDSMETIKEKAKKMVEHYVEQIFTGGFKAQIVANSRIATVHYKAAIDEAVRNKVRELKSENPMLVDVPLLEKVETAVVISGSHNDQLEIKAFTNSEYHKKAIKRFKLPFGAADEDDNAIDGNVGIIIVNNMLLTGFDAPIEQVIYLDRVIVAHNLLQTIARVNRVSSEGKEKGFVVDFVGVGHHLKRAIEDSDAREAVVDADEIDNILSCIANDESELNELTKAHEAIRNFLAKHRLTDLSDVDAFFDLFYDEDIRFEYMSLYKKLTSGFNNVLPRKEALEFFVDWKSFTEINALAEKHFRDHRFSMKGIPPKLRAIAEEFLISRGIDQSVAPISIIADDFQQNVNKRHRDKTKAAEVEHAVRHYIDINIDEDPELFASFAQTLDEILKNFRGHWKEIYEELEKLREKIKNREKEETYGLDRRKQMPIFRILKAELFDNRKLSEDEIAKNVNLTQHVCNVVINEIKLTGFWNSIPAQNRLQAELKQTLLSQEFINYSNMYTKHKELISKIMELAKTNHYKMIQN